MADAFYPFVENGGTQEEPDGALVVRYPARIAVFDDVAAAPRVVVVEPKDIRSYLEEITATVTPSSSELPREVKKFVEVMMCRTLLRSS